MSIPYSIGTVQDFLGDNTYFGPGSWIQLSTQDFTGTWEYTAIASEASNENITESPYFTVQFSPSSSDFTNANSVNWGIFSQIDFDTGNIYFEDGNNPYDVSLDPFDLAASGYFSVFRLTAPSKELSYLASGFVLPEGTIIVGYNDNSDPPTQDNKDLDFDDMVIAIRAIKPVDQVPEPTTLLLLSSGLLGLVALRRRRKA